MLTLNSADITHGIAAFLWPFFRIGALMMIMPTLGGGEVPARVRIGFAFLLTWLVLPGIDQVPVLDVLSAESLYVTLQELLLGVAMGLVVLMVFSAVMLGAENVAVTMGLGFAMMNDPQSGVQVPTVGQFYRVLAILLFLVLGGHFAMLSLLVESFRHVPVGTVMDTGVVWRLLQWGGSIFKGALLIALPALTAMLMSNMIMGVMTRSAPQLNLFSVGFPITMTIGFVAMVLTLPAFSEAFQGLMQDAFDLMLGWW